MPYRSVLEPILLSLALLSAHCSGPPESGNPLEVEEGPSAESSLHLYLPLPKPLAQIVDRVVARLEGPGMQPIVAELEHGPLGPATGTIGAIPPGEERTLVVQGYDLVGTLIFEGRQEGISIQVGDTTRVEIELFLVSPGGEDGGDGAGPGDEVVIGGLEPH